MSSRCGMPTKNPVSFRGHEVMNKRTAAARSSSIQTLLLVPELHRISRSELGKLTLSAASPRVADCTASREFHPAPKTILNNLPTQPGCVLLVIVHYNFRRHDVNTGSFPYSTRSAHSADHCPARGVIIVDPANIRSKRPQLLGEVLISSLDVADVVNVRPALRRKRGDHQRGSCP